MRKLLDWEREAMVIAVSSGEKSSSVASEFGVSDRYPRLLAARRGATNRPIGRPITKKEQPIFLVLVTR